MDPVSHAAALDELAGSLRERLLARAGEGPDEAGAEAGIRELVEREAALLDPADREELVARVAERSFGLGPLEPLCDARLPDPAALHGSRTRPRRRCSSPNAGVSSGDIGRGRDDRISSGASV